MKLEPFIGKTRYWARNPRVVATPRIANLPPIPSRKFDSHEEFNAWKREWQHALIRAGGAKWTR